MNYLIIFLVLVSGFNIYFHRGQKRFDWFVCSMMIFSSGIILLSKPQMPCHRFLLICYWFSVLKNKEYSNKVFPLKWILLVYILGLLVVSFNSPHLNVFYKLYKPFVFLIDTYLILLLTAFCITKETFCSKAIIRTLYFVMLYGVLTFLIHQNPIQSIVTSSFGSNAMLTEYYFGERIRITSTWVHPIAYGLVCGALFYQFLPFWKLKKIQLLMLLLAMNVFLCGSRTSLGAFFLMGGVILLTRYNITRAIKQILIVSMLAIPVYFSVPMVQDKVDSLVNTAMGKDDVSGSSLEMRDEQTYYAMLIVDEKPILGHGLDYITEVMGFNTKNFKGDWHLLGLESYSYSLMIERGFFGFFMELFFWLAIVLYAYYYRNSDRENSSLVIAYILGFAFFSMSTGTLDTKIPMFLMVGTALSKMNIKRNYDSKITGHRRSGFIK